jgi:hypothetical protein
VNILLNIAGHVEVDDMLHIGNIQTTGSHSGGNCKQVKYHIISKSFFISGYQRSTFPRSFMKKLYSLNCWYYPRLVKKHRHLSNVLRILIIVLCCGSEFSTVETLPVSVVDPKLFVTDPDPFFNEFRIRIRLLKSSGSGFGSN